MNVTQLDKYIDYRWFDREYSFDMIDRYSDMVMVGEWSSTAPSFAWRSVLHVGDMQSRLVRDFTSLSPIHVLSPEKFKAATFHVSINSLGVCW